MSRSVLVLSLSLLLLGCDDPTYYGPPDDQFGWSPGEGGPSGSPPQPEPEPDPVEYEIVSDYRETFGYFHGFNFTIPEDAEVHYEVVSPDRDLFDTAIFTPAQWVSYQNGAGNQVECCVHLNDPVISESVRLPAGEYFLGFSCNNRVFNCTVRYWISATY